MSGKESRLWREIYRSPVARDRREATLARKLALLGLDRADRDAKVLDMCCGEGETLRLLWDWGFRQLEGVDLELPEALRADDRFRLQCKDVTATGLPDASFDWIVCIHSLHHLTRPEAIGRFLSECGRILRPGGRLALVDFYASPQAWAALTALRLNPLRLPQNYLGCLSALVRDEWPYLRDYLSGWTEIRRLLHGAPGLRPAHQSRGLMYFYLVLEKTETKCRSS